MDDVRAVMDAAGSRQAILFGMSESTPLAILFAATYPERVTALALYAAYTSETRAPDYPWAPTAQKLDATLDAKAQTIHEVWASGDDLAYLAPAQMYDPAFRTFLCTLQRLSASPGAVIALDRLNAVVDVRHVLPTIRQPTLVIHRTGTVEDACGPGRYVAAHIPGAKLVELPGVDYLPSIGDTDALVDEIETFVTGVRPVRAGDSVLATILTVELCDAAGHALAAGSLVSIPHGVAHTFWNAGEVPARQVTVFTPAGIEHYFAEATAILAAGDEQAMEATAALMERHDTIVVASPRAAYGALDVNEVDQ